MTDSNGNKLSNGYYILNKVSFFGKEEKVSISLPAEIDLTKPENMEIILDQPEIQDLLAAEEHNISEMTVQNNTIFIS